MSAEKKTLIACIAEKLEGAGIDTLRRVYIILIREKGEARA